MARTKQTPVKGKYSKTLLYRYTNNNIDNKPYPRATNYIPPLARRRRAFEARKAAWEVKNPHTPYPHSRPEADNRRGAAARK
jgi:hypothetical protein